MKVSIVDFMLEFCFIGFILPGCNSSLITLIPKVIKEFRPINLIGVLYKIIAKTPANCLALVVISIVGVEQSAFIKRRHILDGSFGF